MYRVSGSNSWKSILGVCQAAEVSVPGDPFISSHPSSGCVMSDVEELVVWDDNNSTVEQYWLYIGTNKGWADIYNSYNIGDDNSVLAVNLPNDGQTVHIRLWFKINGSWDWLDQTCESWTAPTPPSLTSHDVNNCVFSSTNEQLAWQDNDYTNISSYWLYVGSSLGSANIYNSGSLTNTNSVSIPGLPDDGSIVHLRLWFNNAGSWGSIDQSCHSVTI